MAARGGVKGKPNLALLGRVRCSQCFAWHDSEAQMISRLMRQPANRSMVWRNFCDTTCEGEFVRTRQGSGR